MEIIIILAVVIVLAAVVVLIPVSKRSKDIIRHEPTEKELLRQIERNTRITAIIMIIAATCALISVAITVFNSLGMR